ncbi:MAG: hypothetical protein M1820_002782 [Bogoriella megaspora]|nr:MAG: hypothetical protein M1820_002782 [Bogoriella megaspora]
MCHVKQKTYIDENGNRSVDRTTYLCGRYKRGEKCSITTEDEGEFYTAEIRPPASSGSSSHEAVVGPEESSSLKQEPKSKSKLPTLILPIRGSKGKAKERKIPHKRRKDQVIIDQPDMPEPTSATSGHGRNMFEDPRPPPPPPAPTKRSQSPVAGPSRTRHVEIVEPPPERPHRRRVSIIQDSREEPTRQNSAEPSRLERFHRGSDESNRPRHDSAVPPPTSSSSSSSSDSEDNEYADRMKARELARKRQSDDLRKRREEDAIREQEERDAEDLRQARLERDRYREREIQRRLNREAEERRRQEEDRRRQEQEQRDMERQRRKQKDQEKRDRARRQEERRRRAERKREQEEERQRFGYPPHSPVDAAYPPGREYMGHPEPFPPYSEVPPPHPPYGYYPPPRHPPVDISYGAPASPIYGTPPSPIYSMRYPPHQGHERRHDRYYVEGRPRTGIMQHADTWATGDAPVLVRRNTYSGRSTYRNGQRAARIREMFGQ